MVPRWIIDPDLVVFITGVLELAGAAGLLFRFTRPLAVAGLVVLLIAIFPANIKAARDHLTIRGLPATLGKSETSMFRIFSIDPGSNDSPARSGMIPDKSRISPSAAKRPGLSWPCEP